MDILQIKLQKFIDGHGKTVHRKWSKDDRQQILRQEAHTVERSGQAGTKRARSRERVAEFFTHVQTPERRAE
jgi:hypothetical protein